MRRPAEPSQSSEAHDSTPSVAPKPFNIFEGLPQEPLPPIEDSSNSFKPISPLVRRQEQTPFNDAASPAGGNRKASIYILIAVVALVIGVLIGIVLK